MLIWVQKLFASLLFWLYDLLDGIFELFGVLCGIQTVEVDGGESPLINIFLTHSAVTNVFLGIFLLSVFLAAVCVAVSVFRSVINIKGGERKSHAKSIGQGAIALITSLFMVIVVIAFITVSNTTLSYIQHTFNSDYDNLKFSQILFDMSVESNYVYDYSDPQIVMIPVYDENGNPVYDELGLPKYEPAKDATGNIIYEYKYKEDENGNLLIESGWQDGYTAKDINFAENTVDDVFGIHEKDLWIFENPNRGYIAGHEAKVDMQSFNFLTAYIVVIVMMVAIIWAMLGLVKRLYDIVLLFLIMPLIISTLPLDDGARFKTWRETMISKVVLAYGAIFTVNIFILMTPIINSINFVSLGWDTFVSTIFKMFLLMGGALSINAGQLLIARLVGTDASESREMAQSARALLAGGAAATGLVVGAKNLAIGGTNKYGRFRQGIIPTAAKGAFTVGNRVSDGSFGQMRLGRILGHIGRVPQNTVANSLSGKLDGNTNFTSQDVTSYMKNNNDMMAGATNNGNLLDINRNQQKSDNEFKIPDYNYAYNSPVEGSFSNNNEQGGKSNAETLAHDIVSNGANGLNNNTKKGE